MPIKPIVLAVTGASATQLAERLLELMLLKDLPVELIISKGAFDVWHSEMGVSIPVDSIKQEQFFRNRFSISTGSLTCHRWNNNSSRLASGSYLTSGMIILPCTMGTLGRISSGFAQNLIERCADVHLKESRLLILSPRETPFNLIHLRNMTNLAEAGAKIIPCIPSWYSHPESLSEMVDFMVVRLFDSFGIELKTVNRWPGAFNE